MSPILSKAIHARSRGHAAAMDLRDATSVNPRYATSDCSEFWDLKKVGGLAGSPGNCCTR